MNDTYQLDSIVYKTCNGLNVECHVEEFSSFEEKADTIILRRNKYNLNKDLVLAFEKKFIFNENEELLYRYSKQNDVVTFSEYKYQDELILRNDWIKISGKDTLKKATQFSYDVNGRLEEIFYIDKIELDTTSKITELDDKGRIVFFGAPNREGNEKIGSYYSYDEKLNLPIRKNVIKVGNESSFTQSIKYDEYGNVKSLSDPSTGKFQFVFTYDSDQRISKGVIENGPFTSSASYEYNSDEDLVLFVTETKRGEEVIELDKTEFFYGKNKIPFGYSLFQMLKNEFASYVQFDAVAYFGMYDMGQALNLKFALRNIPTQIISYKKDLSKDVWVKTRSYTFYFSEQ